MAWKYISYICIALTTASAFRQIRYLGLIYQEDDSPSKPMIHRRVDTRDITFVDRSDRAQNERSIPFRSNSQMLPEQSWGRNGAPRIYPEPRNGNMSLRVGNPLTRATIKRDNPVSSDSLVFPGSTSSSMFVPEIPIECDNHIGICEQIPNYPQQYVDDLLSKMPDVKYRFNLDVETSDTAHRGPKGDKEMCNSTNKIIYPKAAKNIQGKWVLVVNRDGQPIQGFKTEICEVIDQTCNEIKYLSSGYSALCCQKRIDRRMWSLDQNGDMVMAIIPVPICCSCCLISV